MMSVRYMFSPIADPLVLSPPFPVTGLSPTWEFLVRTSDGLDLTASAPSITEHSTVSGLYYFDIDYENIGGQSAAHVTGLIDWGATLGEARRYQEFRGAATDYSGWLEGYPVTLQLYETGTTTPITQHAEVTLYDSTGTEALSPALSVDANGVIRFAVHNGNYHIVPRSTPYIEWEDLPWTITVNGEALSVTKYGTVWEPSSPATPDACVLFVLAGDIGGNPVSEGTFEITRIVSPSTIGTGDSTQRVVLTDNPVTMENGRAEIQVLQGAVLETRFTPENGIPITKTITVPTASSANWSTL